MTYTQTPQIRFGQRHDFLDGPWGGVVAPSADSERQYHTPKQYVALSVWDAAHPMVDRVDFRVWIYVAGVVADRLLLL